MRLDFKDIIGRHKETPCVVSGHGPSLDLVKKEITALHKEERLLRMCVNNWFDYYETKPDYWTLSSTEFTLESGLLQNDWWKGRGYPVGGYNKFDIPIFFNDSTDLTPLDLIEDLLGPDYLPYDSKHFRGDSCTEIMMNFRSHYEKNRNFNFSYYGNNPMLWLPLDKKIYDTVRCDPVYLDYPPQSWSRGQLCCHRQQPGRLTIQEKLQEVSGHDRHFSTGHTVAYFALASAILMGCNPIYVAGMDLDYRKDGPYAQNSVGAERYFPPGTYGHFKLFHKHIENDLTIINESARKLGIKIINLNKDAWYDSFEKGPLHIE
tara:strand:+ start:454 stop:1410 length:957 start_codon:yes stop_codon:yes gene_type:complete